MFDIPHLVLNLELSLKQIQHINGKKSERFVPTLSGQNNQHIGVLTYNQLPLSLQILERRWKHPKTPLGDVSKQSNACLHLYIRS